MPETVDKVKHWRAKAEELRTIADHCVDPSARATFSRLSEDYDKMTNETEGRWTRSARKDVREGRSGEYV